MVLAAGRAAAFTADQVQFGAWVFRRQCVRCHGADGQGKDDAWKGLRAPELVGPGVFPVDPRPYQQIRRREFRTVLDVFWFVSASMPADQPATLEPEEYWSVLAFILRSNGVAPDGAALGEKTAGELPVPHHEPAEHAGAKAGS
jgi:cytochrome c